jgi:4-fold beta-flower domain-containing protein
MHRFVLCDRDGNALAYSDDGENLFLFTGVPVAFLDVGAVYSYRGELLGWFELGWLRDKNGDCMAFADDAVAGPHKPRLRPFPPTNAKQPIPVRLRLDPRMLRPIYSNNWAEQSAMEFFTKPRRVWPGNLGGTIHNR